MLISLGFNMERVEIMNKTVSKSTGYTLLGAIVFLIGMGVVSWGQADEPMIAWKWTAPTTGTAVVNYSGQIRMITIDGDTALIYVTIPAPADTSIMPTYSMPYQWGASMELRVAGVDVALRQGPWSWWSDPWVDAGPPGVSGKPEGYLEMVTPE